jgi:DinB family protein
MLRLAMDRGMELRRYLARLLDWEDAHVSFDAAVEGIAPTHRGKVPPGLPHSPWQLLEHLRRTQRDILDFCREPRYVELRWPEDYWPPAPAPASDAEWDESVAAFRADREALQAMALDPGVDLLARVPNGDGQTYLRELVLAADHAAYHVGQLVLVRRALGIWK